MKYLFLVLVLLLPTQLGKHWWPEWSLVDGVRVDYLAPTIYLTDILVLLIALCVLFQKTQGIGKTVKQWSSKTVVGRTVSRDTGLPAYRLTDYRSTVLPFHRSTVAFSIVLIIFFLLAGYWILAAERRWLAVYWLGRYLEIAVAAIITSVILRSPQATEGSRRDCHGPPLAGLAMTVLGAAILWSVGLGAAQMVLGRTTGWFWWLGERIFNLATPGVATMTILGREILRPYATFGHPNALAGFIAAATLLLLQTQNSKLKTQNRLLELVGVIGVVLTGSRAAIAALVVAALLKVKSSVVILGVLGGLVILGLSGNTVRFANESGEERIVLAQAAARMWKDSWLFGVGPGQFLAKLPEYLPAGFYKIQPVHNVFLLGLAEFGIIGLSIIIITIIKVIKSAGGAKSAGLKWAPVLAVIFVTGMVDHYWLTAQQNRLLLGVILGMMIGSHSEKPAQIGKHRLKSDCG